MALSILVEQSLNVAPVRVERRPTLPMQAITIMASITAYSTAVGPSSDARNLRIDNMKVNSVPSKEASETINASFEATWG